MVSCGRTCAGMVFATSWMTASPGDWIIRGVVGELYPCKPDIFVQTYEATGEPDDAPAPLKAARG